jgi:hypothetical protein
MLQVALIGQHSTQLVGEARKMLEASPEQTDDLKRLYTLINYLDEIEASGISTYTSILLHQH